MCTSRGRTAQPVCPARKAAGGAPPGCEGEPHLGGPTPISGLNPGGGGAPSPSAHVPGGRPGSAQPDLDRSQQGLVVAVMRRAAPPWAALTAPVGTASLGLSYALE